MDKRYEKLAHSIASEIVFSNSYGHCGRGISPFPDVVCPNPLSLCFLLTQKIKCDMYG